MTTETKGYADSELEGYEPYRSVSKAAIASLVLGLIAVAALLFPPLLVVPAAGIACGAAALLNIRRFPLELAGKVPAVAGVVLSTALFASGSVLHSVVYLTEVPEGYQRVSFADLQPVKRRPELPVSPSALELSGQKVYVKGYVYPDGRQDNIKQFVLVRDMGTCCFGGQPPLTHMILVTLQDPLRVEYALRKRGLGGVLKVDTQKKPVTGLDGVYYQLDADYLR
jgi:hypothetical protein